MKLLIDTCIVIPVEPTDVADLEPETEVIAVLQRVCQLVGCQTYVHPASLAELARDGRPERREAREKLIQRYVPLERPPGVSAKLESLIGAAMPGSHDEIDGELLAAVFEDAVDYLVTTDEGLLKNSVRAGVENRVGTPAKILRLLEDTLPREPAPRPCVRKAHAYELDEQDTIFDLLRAEYTGFDAWLAKCKREHRPVWLVERYDGSCAAVCIAKHEVTGKHALTGKVLKICTFAVAHAEFGRGYGELLLKAVFDYAFLNTYDMMYVEVYSHHGDVVRLFGEFGFKSVDASTSRGELVLAKRLTCTPAERDAMSPLDYNVSCGPQRIKLAGARVFVVPIQPRYHVLLFPGADIQPSLLDGQFPFGNAIRKAYLCNAKLKQIPPGALVLFYRSHSRQGVYCIGVAERSIRSRDPLKILRFVGTRTVYPLRAIEKLCQKDVLAVVFRHALTLDPQWSLAELTRAEVLKGHPQSITEVPKEAFPWLESELVEWL